MAIEELKSAFKTTHPKGPESLYTARVGFDTIEAVELPHNHGGGLGICTSFSLSSKSVGFIKSRKSRLYVCAYNESNSENALNFVINSLLEDNDELVILRVIELDSVDGKVFQSRQGPEEVREDAEKLLETVKQKNHQTISITVEIVVGPIEESIHRIIEIYRPDSLVVGTKGVKPSLWKSAAGSSFMGSISRYCVAKSPVPVIVVRPTNLIEHDLQKRINEASRPYVSLLDHAERPILRSRNSSPSSRDNSRNNSRNRESAPLRRPKTAPASASIGPPEVEEKRGRQPSLTGGVVSPSRVGTSAEV